MILYIFLFINFLSLTLSGNLLKISFKRSAFWSSSFAIIFASGIISSSTISSISSSNNSKSLTSIKSSPSKGSSISISDIFSPLLLEIANIGGCEKLIQNAKGFRHGVYIYNGTLTSSILGDAFKLPYKNLDLLISAL